ncbi:MAG TPA: ABC transporter substrate-binding protein [Chloroflexota bacterium]|nr:ABC transporter substrate-binding protein [Chloroflexota bacterium]
MRGWQGAQWGRRLAAGVVGVMALAAVACSGAAPAARPSAPEPAAGGPPAPGLAVSAQPAPGEPIKLTVPYTPLAASSLPLWDAAEEGRFTKYGLDVALEYVGGASAIIQAMVGGQWDVGIISGGDAALNRLQGGDMLLVGSFVSNFTLEPWAKPEITQFSDLKGKVIPVTRFGTASYFAAVAMLAAGGLQRDDATILQSGGTQETMTALVAGQADAAPLGYPWNLEARKAGFHRLTPFTELGDYGLFPQNVVGVRESWLQEPRNRDVALRFLRGLDEGRALAKSDVAVSKASLQKYTKVDDAAVLQETVDFYRAYFPDSLEVPEQSIASMLRLLDNPAAATADPKQFYDNRLVAEIGPPAR